MTTESIPHVVPSDIDVKLMVAIIAASTAIFTITLKEGLDWLKNKSQQKQKLADYAKPFSAKAGALFWRLNEIIILKRHQYLSSSGNGIEFYDYKLSSSVYRLNCFLAQLKIIRDEVNHFKKSKEKSQKILKAANSVQESLADGHHVEEKVLKKLLKEFSISTMMQEEIDKIIPEFGTHLQLLISGQDIKRLSDLRRIDEKEAVGFMEGAKTFLEIKGHTCRPSQSHDPRTVLASIAYKEYYLYRDWQDAIAAAMIQEGKIIDYGTFEKIYKNEDDPNHEIISRSKNLFISIDPDDPRDLRVKQIRKTLKNLASLLEILKDQFPECETPPQNHINKAKEINEK